MGASELFVHVPPRVDRLPDERAAIVRIVDAAHASGLQVSALGGDASWLDDPDDVVERWLTPALAAAAFDGIHLDVEPPVDPDDPDPALVNRFLALVRQSPTPVHVHCPSISTSGSGAGEFGRGGPISSRRCRDR